MALSGSSFLGFLIAVVSILTTAIDFSKRVKYSFAVLLGVLTVIPLAINLVVFLKSPFSRLLHLRCEFYKLVLSDSFDSWDDRKRLKGESIYCNQSRVKRSVQSSKKVLKFWDTDGFENLHKIKSQNTIEKIGFKEIWDEKEISFNFRIDTVSTSIGFAKCNAYEDLADSPLDLHLLMHIHDLKVDVVWYNCSTNLTLSYPGSDPVNISCQLEWENFLDLLFILRTHKDRPESGLCKLVSSDKRSTKFHSMSYQSITSYLSKNRLYYTDEEVEGDFVVEGLEEDTKLFTNALMNDLSVRFGHLNVNIIVRHHLIHWGKINKSAIGFITSKTSARCYKSIGSNWKSKRYLVDVSLFLEKMGLPRFQCLDMSIKATKLACSLATNIRMGTGGVFKYERVKKVDVEAEEKKCKLQLSKRLPKLERDYIVSEMKSLKFLKMHANRSKMKTKYQPRKLNLLHENHRETCESTNDVKESMGVPKIAYESTYPRLSDELILIREKTVEMDYMNALKMEVSSRSEDLKRRVVEKGIGFFKKACNLIEPVCYSNALNVSKCSIRSKVKHLEQLGRYNGFEPKFPCNPVKWHNTGKHILKRQKNTVRKDLPISIENRFKVLDALNQEEDENVSEINKPSSVCIMNTWKRLHREKEKISKNKQKKNAKYLKSKMLKASKNPCVKKRKMDSVESEETPTRMVKPKKGAFDLSKRLKLSMRNARIDSTIIKNKRKIEFKAFMERNKTSILYKSLVIGGQSERNMRISKEHAAERGFPDY